MIFFRQSHECFYGEFACMDFFPFNFTLREYFFFVQWNPTLPTPVFDHLVITTIFFRPKRKKSLSHFIILKTSIMLPPRYYDQDFLGQRSGRTNGVPLYFGRPCIRFS